MKFRFIALLAGVFYSAALLAATPASCPTVGALQYDAANSTYGAQVGVVTWVSLETVGFNPLPTVVYQGMSARGSQSSARVTCSYKVGNNNVSLNTSTIFSLGNGWSQLSGSSPVRTFICAANQSCEFSSP